MHQKLLYHYWGYFVIYVYSRRIHPLTYIDRIKINKKWTVNTISWLLCGYKKYTFNYVPSCRPHIKIRASDKVNRTLLSKYVQSTALSLQRTIMHSAINDPAPFGRSRSRQIPINVFSRISTTFTNAIASGDKTIRQTSKVFDQCFRLHEVTAIWKTRGKPFFIWKEKVTQTIWQVAFVGRSNVGVCSYAESNMQTLTLRIEIQFNQPLDK